MYSNPLPIPPGEEWYYELDGRTHGPLSRSDLEDLLNRSGETASEVRVRQGANGPWRPFRSPIPPPMQAIGPGSQSHSEASRWGDAAHSSSSGSWPKSGPLRGFWRAHWEIATALGAWIGLNALFLLFWPPPHSRERDYLTTLREIEADVRALRAKPASDAEWLEFRERTRATLAPIVADLKKSASPSEPVRQQLFWSARDIIPHTLGPRTKERDEQDQRLKQYLEAAERELGQM